MKNKLFLSLVLSTIFSGCTLLGTNQTNPGASPTPDTSPTPTSQTSPDATFPTQPNPDNNQSSIPTDWTRAYDGAINVLLAYPQGWTLSPAIGQQGELAVTSFDPNQTPDTGGVSQSAIKVGITFFAPNNTREITFQESEIINQTQTTIDGFSATVRDIRGGGGTSKTAQVETDNGTYLISAYPLDSQLLSQYQQILDYIDLDSAPPVTINNPSLGSNIESPLNITGTMPGSWMNEGTTTVELRDTSLETITSTQTQTQENWMTTQPVNFSAQFEFSPPSTPYGFIFIQKANPSGRPNNSQLFTWPIQFE